MVLRIQLYCLRSGCAILLFKRPVLLVNLFLCHMDVSKSDLYEKSSKVNLKSEHGPITLRNRKRQNDWTNDIICCTNYVIFKLFCNLLRVPANFSSKGSITCPQLTSRIVFNPTNSCASVN